MSNSETIAAIATPLGAGGIGIVRLSGLRSLEILQQVFQSSAANFRGFRPWVLHHGQLRDAKGLLDDVLAVYMPGPKTFTGEDVAEIHGHGGLILLQATLERCLQLGATLAQPGEFTRRAFMNGRLDLTQAEAIAELIAAQSQEGARLAAVKLSGLLGQRITDLRLILEELRAQFSLALDFPDDEIESLDSRAMLELLQQVQGSVQELLSAFERSATWREGLRIALAGEVNVGKSSLLNALLGRERAIVSSTPGTTRDFLEETINLQGLTAKLVDTAGLRPNPDLIEAAGINLGKNITQAAEIVLLLVDGSCGVSEETQELLSQLGGSRTILVWNKQDLQPLPDPLPLRICPAAVVSISAKSGQGLEVLSQAIKDLALSLTGTQLLPTEIVPNLRQATTLQALLLELDELALDISADIPYDLCAARLNGAIATLSEITGLDTSEQILNRIFDTFCIGK